MTRILLIDDDEKLGDLLGTYFELFYLTLLVAHEPQAGLEMLDQEDPDLVILDIMLPEIDGFEVCRRIKADDETKHIPVVMLTAKKSREDMARGEQVGADWYITKPFKSAMVIETIQRFID